MWNDSRIKKAIIKSILTSIFLMLILFLVDNRSYLFTYLPYQFAYEQKEAYVQYGRLRYEYVWVSVMEQDEAIAMDTVKRGCGESAGSMITVGYAPDRNPSVVRTSLIVTNGQIVSVIILILGNLLFVRKLHRANG